MGKKVSKISVERRADVVNRIMDQVYEEYGPDRLDGVLGTKELSQKQVHTMFERVAEQLIAE